MTRSDRTLICTAAAAMHASAVPSPRLNQDLQDAQDEQDERQVREDLNVYSHQQEQDDKVR